MVPQDGAPEAAPAWPRRPTKNVLQCGSRSGEAALPGSHPEPNHGHHPHTGRRAADRRARRRTDGRRRRRPAGHLSPDPAVGRRARLHDLVDPVQSQARAHPRATRRCRCRSRIPSRWADASTGSRSRATPGSSRRTRTAAGSASCRSGRPRSRRSSTSSRRGSRCRSSSSARSSRSPRAGSCTGPMGSAASAPVVTDVEGQAA